jgi:hypothetical protein
VYTRVLSQIFYSTEITPRARGNSVQVYQTIQCQSSSTKGAQIAFRARGPTNRRRAATHRRIGLMISATAFGNARHRLVSISWFRSRRTGYGECRRGAAYVVIGFSPAPPVKGEVDLHLLPVVAGQIVDLTLDAHTDRPDFDMRALPPVVSPMPDSGEVSTVDAAPYAGDVCYFEAGTDCGHLGTAYRQRFWKMGGRKAADEMVALW